MRSLGSWLVAVVFVACGPERSGVAPGPDAPKPVTPPAEKPPAAPANAARHEGSGTVLDKRGVGPQLCLGGVAESLPPQCGGIPLVGWDWAKVDGEQTAGDTTWGQYRVVGTYDGQRLTPTEPPGPPRYVDEPFTFDPPCEQPAGGWSRPNPKKMTQADFDRANAAAQKMPGYAGLWMYNPDVKGERQDLADIVLCVTFTGELEKREADLRKLWGGALCVARQAHSEAEIAAIRAKAEAKIQALGMGMLGSSTDVVRGTIRVDVTVATAGQLAALAREFGDVLVVSARLRPRP